MDIFNVSFIGHRRIENFSFVENSLDISISNLLRSKEYIEFYIGNNGEFDTIATSAIRRNRKKHGTNNSAVTLVLPYKKANMSFYESQFDSVLIPSELHEVYHKKP